VITMGIQQRYEKIVPCLSAIERLWREELNERKHLLSISSSVGKEFQWDPNRIKEFCLRLGFNGAEIRFENFKDPYVLGILSGSKDFFLTGHLTDFAYWLYSSQQISRIMQKEERKTYFGNPDHQRAVKERFLQELELAEKLGINILTFHAAQIELLGVLEGNFLFSDEEVLDRVKEFVIENLSLASFKGKLGLENDSVYTKGMRLPQHFETLLNSINMPSVGITLDTAHLVAHSIKLELSDKVMKRTLVVHLSEPNPLGTEIPKVSTKEIQTAIKQGFMSLRSLAGKVAGAVDVHNPVGEVITDIREVLSKLYQVSPSVIIVHELKTSLDLLPQACKIQQAQLVTL